MDVNEGIFSDHLEGSETGGPFDPEFQSLLEKLSEGFEEPPESPKNPAAPEMGSPFRDCAEIPAGSGYELRSSEVSEGVHCDEIFRTGGETPLPESARETSAESYIVPGERDAEGFFHPAHLESGLQQISGRSIVGEPLEDSKDWHLQTTPRSCAVACQTFAADQLTGKLYSEKAFLRDAEKNGWYDNGTALADVGKELESKGFTVQRSLNNSLDDIRDVLQTDGKVIVAVNSGRLLSPGVDTDVVPKVFLPFLPGYGPDHAVEVTGIDETDPKHKLIILNDPGIEGGAGDVYTAEEFTDAWDSSNRFMASVSLQGGNEKC